MNRPAEWKVIGIMAIQIALFIAAVVAGEAQSQTLASVFYFLSGTLLGACWVWVWNFTKPHPTNRQEIEDKGRAE